MVSSRHRRILPAVILCLLGLLDPGLRSEDHRGCVVVNNSSNNRLSVLAINGHDGTLRDPFIVATGGLGVNGGYFAIPQIAATAPVGGQGCVFAANAGTHDVSRFRLVPNPG